MLLKKYYGLNKSEKTFWRELFRSFYVILCSIINADPCIFFKWTEIVLLVWLSWIDYCAYFVRYDEVEKSKNRMMKLFDCEICMSMLVARSMDNMASPSLRQ